MPWSEVGRWPDVAELGGLAQCLSHLDNDGALALIERAGRDGTGLEMVVTGLLAPSLVEVGRQWAAGEIGAAEAAAAASIVRSCLGRASIAAIAPIRGRRPVAVCCPPGEHHELPAEMVTSLLREYGWPAYHLGSGVTTAHLSRFLARQEPMAVLVSATTPCGLAGTAEVIAVAHAHGVPVIVGGAAFGRDDLLALRLGAAARAASARDAVALLETWHDRPPVLPAGRAWPEEYLAFEARRPEIQATASAALCRPGGGAQPGVDSEYRIELLLRHLGAALLVDDGRLFLDFLSSRSEYYEARHLGPDPLGQALYATATALPPELSQCRRFLDEGNRHLAWANRAHCDTGSGWPPPQPPPLPAPSQPVASPGSTAGRDQAGKVFSDLLFVAVSSCRAPQGFISVAQPDGRWSTLSHSAGGGTPEFRDKPGEEQLFALVAGQDDPLEIRDFAAHPELQATALVRSPAGFRYAYGVPLRSRQGAVLGVLCILDRRARELSSRERQAVSAIARQVAAQVALLRGDEPAATANRDPRPTRRPAKRAAAHGPAEGDRLLHSHEVAVLFDVTDRTVMNWAAANKLPSVRTAGRHLRFRGDDVFALLAGQPVNEAGGI